MTYHVDVILTDWAAGTEQLVARLSLNGRGVEVTDSVDRALWESKLLVPIRDEFDGEVDPRTGDPKDFLALFVKKYADGSYVRAIGPHHDEECPLKLVPGERADMRRVV